MNVKEFVKILNKIIENKIKKMVPKLVEDEVNRRLNIILSNKKTPNTNESINENTNGISLRDVDKYMDLEEESNEIPDIDFSNNGKSHRLSDDALNYVLNDTKKRKKAPQQNGNQYYQQQLNENANYMQSEIENDYNDVDGGYETVYADTSNMGAINSHHMGRQIQMQPQDQHVNVLKNQMASQGASPDITNKMIRNYSSFLKDVDKKAKSKYRRGG